MWRESRSKRVLNWGVQTFEPSHHARTLFDGAPDTLRLLFATPRRWLEDGQTIKVEWAPTAFGPVSILAQSKLSEGKVIAEVDLLKRNTLKQTLLRIRTPDGWHVTSAHAGTVGLKVDQQGTADISGLRGKVTLEFHASGNWRIFDLRAPLHKRINQGSSPRLLAMAFSSCSSSAVARILARLNSVKESPSTTASL